MPFNEKKEYVPPPAEQSVAGTGWGFLVRQPSEQSPTPAGQAASAEQAASKAPAPTDAPAA